MTEAHARLGTVLSGKYRLDALLGLGGMACVYAATHRNGRRVAVKVLHRVLSCEPEIRRRFLREGYVANKLDHPGAVAILDDDEAADGSVYLVMELLRGETLQARAERRGSALGVPETLAAADLLLDVLAAAHAKGVVHRDIKPENLYVTPQGELRVLDFGIARLREGLGDAPATWTGMMMGTPGFMAPEQAKGLWDQVDARTDLWAAGATMFSLLTGALPHAAATPHEHVVAGMVAPARPLRSVAPEIPEPVAQLVDRALAFERDERFPDAASMRQAVRAAFAAVVGTPLGSPQRLLGEAAEASVFDEPTVQADPSEATEIAVASTLLAPRARVARGALLAAIVAAVALAGGAALLVWPPWGSPATPGPPSANVSEAPAPPPAAASVETAAPAVAPSGELPDTPVPASSREGERPSLPTGAPPATAASRPTSAATATSTQSAASTPSPSASSADPYARHH